MEKTSIKSKIQVLDCTLRDGGLGLEDAYLNCISDIQFKYSDIDSLIRYLSHSDIDIIELGSIEISDMNKKGFAIYQNIQEVSKKIPNNKSNRQMYVGLYRGPDTNLDEIPDWNEELVDGVRVIIRYSELEKSLEFCSELSNKGYKVFVQPMLTMRYTDEELDMIIKATNEMNAYALYFVDSYGYMQEGDVKRLFEYFDKRLNPCIKIGFHAHNNMNLAFSNVVSFINFAADHRDIIIDSCCIGMGQGAGNLQTEIITSYLNMNYNAQYCFSKILDACEIIEKYMSANLWGYSVTRLLPAIHKTAYKYAVAMRKKYNLKFSRINELLEKMPQELRNRYTSENLKKLLEENDI